MSQALREAAQLNKLEIHRVDTVNGILEAYSHAYDVPVVVSFTKSNGVQVWYLYEGRCESCNRRQACINLLKAEAEERTIQLKEEDLHLPPTQLGKKIFSTITKTQLGKKIFSTITKTQLGKKIFSTKTMKKGDANGR